jgi:Raf kinase inhibitor-like YbhB/YbcL family protein
MLEKLPGSVGHALQGMRAGMDKTACRVLELRQGAGAIRVSSPAFADEGTLPARCTADGEGISPPLQWSGIPPEADSVVVFVEDADSPTPHPLVHALAFGLPPSDGGLSEGAMGGAGRDGEPAVAMGRNSYLKTRWLPPDPPPGHGAHRYVFQVFALRAGDELVEAPGREALLAALSRRALASGCLVGFYARE